jgi:C-terminal processing protease CtpA/Prc
MPLSDGQALKITTSRYFTPAGISINGVGIVPDTCWKDRNSHRPIWMREPSQPTPAPAAITAAMTLAQRDPQVARWLCTH